MGARALRGGETLSQVRPAVPWASASLGQEPVPGGLRRRGPAHPGSCLASPNLIPPPENPLLFKSLVPTTAPEASLGGVLCNCSSQGDPKPLTHSF